MKPYTLHLPNDAPIGEPEALDRAVLVRDTFSWGAFIFTALWFFWHRLWLVGLAVLVGLFLVQAGLQALGAHPTAVFLAQILLSLLLGLEAASLRRWTLRRRGRPEVDTVMADGLEEAETKAFRRWLDRRPPPLPASIPGTVGAGRPAEGSPVIGLFPQAERSL
ncbi:DUF2628 domain-containing protein [Salinarimonas soli]|uniref:DUF2628 domain-containing protein n=1 Tax=Salinarimonas soli TaxID=1638099 RepID=A0A5B2VHM3_9HYPH|nr:DUF2628 domain-containing protein [Salinarimonas soli]KAA2237852.1 DUF2628 domain-containing protein [Salinarimonas soli]